MQPKRKGPSRPRRPKQRTGYCLEVERIRVREDRVVCYLTLPNDKWRYTTPSLAKRVTSAYPNISRHTCVNAKGNNFGSVIKRTPLPHLMEHLAIDILASRSTDPNDMFTGFSTWVGEKHDQARVEVSMSDDVDTIKAVKDAVQFINKTALELDADRTAGKKGPDAERGAADNRRDGRKQGRKRGRA